MEKITYGELCDRMWKFNETHSDGYKEDATLTGVVVFKESNWKEKYSLESRSYRISNHNQAFRKGKISNSIFGYSLDESDMGVRLDWYKNEWEIDYCYMEEVSECDTSK